jgi:hypothetical protein
MQPTSPLSCTQQRRSFELALQGRTAFISDTACPCDLHHKGREGSMDIPTVWVRR